MQTRIIGPAKAHAFQEYWKNLLILAAAGGAAFWVADFVIAVSPISSWYQAAFSITSLSLALVEALAGGLMIAFCVSLFLIRSFDSLPGKNSIHKALILSFSAMTIIEVLSAIGNPTHAFVYLVLDTGMNILRFLALGWTIGFVFEKQNRKVY